MVSNSEITGFIAICTLFTVVTLRHIVKGATPSREAFVSDSKPHLWWVIDDGEPNTRHWLDWGARLTRKPNMPFLNVHLQRCKELNEKDFHIVPLMGRDEVHQVLLKHGDSVPAETRIAPSWLWNAWASAQMMSMVGGLWMDSHVLSIKSLAPVLQDYEALRFGVDRDEPRVSVASESTGSTHEVCWANGTGLIKWSSYAEDLQKMMKAGPGLWASAEARRMLRYLQDKHLTSQIPTNRAVILTRNNLGKPIELDDLLENTTNTLPNPEIALVPLPADKLNRSIPFAWFKRLSAEQLTEGRFLWARLASNRMTS